MSTQLLLLMGALISSAIVAFLGSAALILESFSKAKLRKLRETSRQLGDIIETDIQRADHLRVVGHMLLAVFFTLAVCFFWNWHNQNIVSSSAFWGIVVFVALVVLLLIQVCSCFIGLIKSAKMMHQYLFFCKICSFPIAPLILLLSWLIRKYKMQYHQQNEEVRVTAEDEILSLVEDTQDDAHNQNNSDGLENDEKRMLNGVIQLDKTFVHEIMTPRVDIDACSENSNIEEIKSAIIACGHSRLPIYRDSIDKIIGIIFAKDLLDKNFVAKAASLLELTHEPVFIPESKNVGDLMDEFRNTHNHLAIVLDEYGGTAGIVTLEDILEEIVGEIQDEYDKEEDPEKEYALDAEGCLVADGRTTICDINKVFDLDISEEQGYDTLAGYIMAYEGKIPEKGAHIMTENLIIDILQADKRRIFSLKVKKRNEKED
ncbi:MAG: hemolysin family protein [Lentisphaeria bacterium]